LAWNVANWVWASTFSPPSPHREHHNRVALVEDKDFDLATISARSIGPNPVGAIAATSALHKLADR
jgi:hypothetical protein